jgi:hypothetical protein
MKSAGSLAGDYSNPSVERNSTASTTNTKKPRSAGSGDVLFFSGCAGAMKLIAKGAINTGE